MKQGLKKLLPIALMALTLSGCGKDNASGGNGNRSSLANPLLNGDFSQVTKQSFQEIQNWYQGAEKPIPGRPNFVRQHISLSSSTNGTTKTWGPFSFTFYGRTSSSNNSSQTYHWVKETLDICESGTTSACSAYRRYEGKANNIELKNALSGKNNSLRLVQAQSLGGGLYAIAYSSNFHGQIDVVYKIDTNLHSLYNPVEIMDTPAGQQNFVQSFF